MALATPAEVNGALGVLSLVGAIGLFLPAVETAWDADPNDAKALHVRRGELYYLATAAGLGLLASYGQGNAVPLALCLILAGTVVVMYEHALRAPSSKAA